SCLPLRYSQSSLDLGLDLLEGEATNEYALLRTRSLAAATALTVGVGGFDDLFDRSLPLVLEQGDRLVRASVHTVGAAIAAFVDHVRYVRFQLNPVTRQDGRGSRHCGLRLQNRLFDGLGRMRQPAQEHAVGHEIYRTQFHVRFKEKSLAVERKFEELRDLLI